MFATTDDINRCKRLLKYVLRDKGISLDDDAVNEIVQKVLALTYSKGGDYTEGSLEEYIKVYLRDFPSP